MSRRWRIFAFGWVAVLIIAGGICGALVGGVAGEVLTIVLLSMGLAGGLLLLFLEVGLSEERDLARDEACRKHRRRESPGHGLPRPRHRRPD
jgi:hypothetical protein